jgi:hypothetical protein
VCLPQIKPEHIGDAVHPGSDGTECALPPPRHVISARDDAAIDPVAIADEVVRSLIPRKRLRYLTCNPFCRRICCDIDPDEVSAVEPDNDEGIEPVENRWLEQRTGPWRRTSVVSRAG